jgi:hypothetical protein
MAFPIVSNDDMFSKAWTGVYERKEEPNGVRLVLSFDSTSINVLEGLRWRPFSGVGQAVFSLLGVKPGGKT